MKALDIFEVEYPFVCKDTTYTDMLGVVHPDEFWKGGCDSFEEDDGSGYSYDTFYKCDGIGKIVFEVLAVTEMPGRYQDRVLYRITMIDPEGGIRKKGRVHCVTMAKFEQYIKGYPFEYELK